MTARHDFDRLVRLWLDEDAAGAEPGYLDDILARVDEIGQNQWRGTLERAIPLRARGARFGPGPSVRLVALLALLTLAVTVAAFVAGARLPRLPFLGDGTGQIAYVSRGDIYVADSEGLNARLLVGGPESDGQPVWSPDGKRLAFYRTNPGSGLRSLWLVEESGEVRRVLSPQVHEAASPESAVPQFPAWSPDSRYLAMSRPAGTSEPRAELVIADVEARSEERFLLPAEHVDAVSWSPRGDLIAATGIVRFASPSLIYDEYQGYADSRVVLVMGTDGSRVQQVSSAAVNGQFMPVWSPTGDALAYVAGISPIGPQGIHVATMSDGRWTERRISSVDTGRATNDLAPSWSSDGQRIAFLRQPKVAEGAVSGLPRSYRSPSRLLVIDAGGGNERQLITDLVASVRPCWTPDDRWVTAGVTGASNSVAGLVLVSSSGDGVVRSIPANEATLPTAGCSWQRLP